MLSYLGKTVVVDVDYPMGYRDPIHGILYPVNYGVVNREKTPYEAYVLGEFTPLEKYEGKVIGVIKHKRALTGALVVAKALNSYDLHQIKALTEFKERYFDSDIITFEFLSSAIRNTAKALIWHDGKVLVLEELHDGIPSYHLPGGGIDFGESSEEALKREIREELGCNVVSCKHIKTVDNLFKVENMSAHEITQIYEVSLDTEPNCLNGEQMTGDFIESHFRLVDPKEFVKGNLKFYPEAFLPYFID